MTDLHKKIKATNKEIHEIRDIVAMTNCITYQERVRLEKLEKRLNKLIKEL